MISVIVPVYNIENYLRKCLDSIINQSYKDLQIILIDDGSTDGSGKICDEYALKDKRVNVIHQKNKGAGAAKNAGLEVVAGEYIAFADGDDYLEIDAYQYMIDLVSRYDADVVQCNFQKVYVDRKEENKKSKFTQTCTAEDFLRRFLNDWTCGLLWDKIFKTTILKDIYFEEGNIVDDDFFTYKGIMNSSVIVCDDKIVYNYRQRKSSVSFLPEYIERRTIYDRINYMCKRRKAVTDRFPELTQPYEEHYANALLWLIRESCLTDKSVIFLKSTIRQYLREPNHTISHKLLIQLYKVLLTKNKTILKNKNAPKGEDFQGDLFD